MAQFQAGADVVQLFESWALNLDDESFASHVIEPNRRIVEGVRQRIPGAPIIGFPRGAAGNLATEDIVFMAHKMGLGTGVDFVQLWDVVYELEHAIGRPIGGRIRQWWESSQDHEPQVGFG